MSAAELLRKQIEYFVVRCGSEAAVVPYWVNWDLQPYFLDAPLRGKGTPAQLQVELDRFLALEVARPEDSEAIRELMRRHGLGLDCSGFAYQLLNTLSEARLGKWLASYLVLNDEEVLKAGRRHKERAFELPHGTSLPHVLPLGAVCELWGKDPIDIAGVARLCDESIAFRVEAVSEMRPGDMIRMTNDNGDHVAVVIEVSQQEVRYAACEDSRTGFGGVTEHVITVVNPALELAEQTWSQSRIYKQHAAHDGVWRLKAFDQIREPA